MEDHCKGIPSVLKQQENGKNDRALKEAFSWNKEFQEFFAVKANPNPFLINILREYGYGCDCSSLTELMLSNAIGVEGYHVFL